MAGVFNTLIHTWNRGVNLFYEHVMGNSPCKECNAAQPKIAEPCESLRVPSTKEYRRCRQPPSTQRSYKRQPEQLRQPVSTPQPWDSQDPGHYRRLRRQPSSTQQSMRQPKQLRQPPSTQQSYTRKHEQLRQPVSIQHPWESQDLSTQHHRRLQQLPSTQHWLIVQIPSTQQHISSPSSPTLSFPTSPSPSPLPPLDWVPSTPSSLPWT
ncbi:protein TALPID3-like [Macrosteles quadrilineatus]|uniref:protein TALPID3-like n=1 Tax=Macrosteles quadrilineatus TaxID=74068 RepID=UPI0023E32F56|nr:protein TALPID3-like [Macrosteles quadrilineatus]